MVARQQVVLAEACRAGATTVAHQRRRVVQRLGLELLHERAQLVVVVMVMMMRVMWVVWMMVVGRQQE